MRVVGHRWMEPGARTYIPGAPGTFTISKVDSETPFCRRYLNIWITFIGEWTIQYDSNSHIILFSYYIL